MRETQVLWFFGADQYKIQFKSKIKSVLTWVQKLYSTVISDSTKTNNKVSLNVYFCQKSWQYSIESLVYCFNKHFPLEKPTQNILFLEVKNLKISWFFLKKKLLNSFSLINRNNLFLFYTGEHIRILYSTVSHCLLASCRWEWPTPAVPSSQMNSVNSDTSDRP